MKFRCNGCGELVETKDVVVVSKPNQWASTILRFYCPDCEEKRTKEKEE